MIPKGYIKKKGKSIPFGYELSEIDKYLKPIPTQLEVLQKYVQETIDKKHSIREGAKLVSAETGRNLNHVSFNRYVTLERKNQEKESDNRPYHYSQKQKAKIEARRKIRDKEKKIKKLKEKISSETTTLKSNKSILTQLDSSEQAISKSAQKRQGQIVVEDDLDNVPKSVKDYLNESHVVFHPNDGPQTAFLAADEKDVLYGGAAGGGKSFAMLVDPLRYCHRKAHRALILRRSMPELRELIDKSRELYPQAFPGCRFREVEKVWNFPSGAKIEFGFLERDADVYRYQGQAYSWIGFDEITHLPTEFGWNYLASRLRTTDSKIKTYLRYTANPGGVGSQWVKKRYVDSNPHNQSFIGKDGLSR